VPSSPAFPSREYRISNLNKFMTISHLTNVGLFLGILLFVNPALLLAGAAAAAMDFYFMQESEKTLGMRRP
jgi:hypothetical protein